MVPNFLSLPIFRAKIPSNFQKLSFDTKVCNKILLYDAYSNIWLNFAVKTDIRLYREILDQVWKSLLQKFVNSKSWKYHSSLIWDCGFYSQANNIRVRTIFQRVTIQVRTLFKWDLKSKKYGIFHISNSRILIAKVSKNSVMFSCTILCLFLPRKFKYFYFTDNVVKYGFLK